MAEVHRLKPRIVHSAKPEKPTRDANKLLKASRGKLQSVLVIGWDLDGALYFASTDGGPDTLWMIEAAKKQLM